jgi:hypothetical protein
MQSCKELLLQVVAFSEKRKEHVNAFFTTEGVRNSHHLPGLYKSITDLEREVLKQWELGNRRKKQIRGACSILLISEKEFFSYFWLEISLFLSSDSYFLLFYLLVRS